MVGRRKLWRPSKRSSPNIALTVLTLWPQNMNRHQCLIHITAYLGVGQEATATHIPSKMRLIEVRDQLHSMLQFCEGTCASAMADCGVVYEDELKLWVLQIMSYRSGWQYLVAPLPLRGAPNYKVAKYTIQLGMSKNIVSFTVALFVSSTCQTAVLTEFLIKIGHKFCVLVRAYAMSHAAELVFHTTVICACCRYSQHLWIQSAKRLALWMRQPWLPVCLHDHCMLTQHVHQCIYLNYFH